MQAAGLATLMVLVRDNTFAKNAARQAGGFSTLSDLLQQLQPSPWPGRLWREQEPLSETDPVPEAATDLLPAHCLPVVPCLSQLGEGEVLVQLPCQKFAAVWRCRAPAAARAQTNLGWTLCRPVGSMVRPSTAERTLASRHTWRLSSAISCIFFCKGSAGADKRLAGELCVGIGDAGRARRAAFSAGVL